MMNQAKAMTCFWDAILRKLDATSNALLSSPRHPEELLSQLQKANTNTHLLVKWQGACLSEHESQEHFDAVACHNAAQIRHGHPTAACDSFLLLLCVLCSTKIEHTSPYGHFIYEPVRPRRAQMQLLSSASHMS